MKFNYIAVLLMVLVGTVLLTGCTSTTPTPVVTPTPQIIYVTVTPTPTVVSTAAFGTITTARPVAPTTPLPSSADPVLHRYLYTYPNANGFMGNEVIMGRELRFYPGGSPYETGGTVDYRTGYVTEISGNTRIIKIVSEASGTWIPMGNNTYYIKVLPTDVGGAQLIRHFTLIPAHTNPSYPGITYPEQIIASDGSAYTRQSVD